MMAIGTMGGVVGNASAVHILPGNYMMTINTTPLISGVPDFGTNGNLNSGFFLNCLPGTAGCGNSMTDNGLLVGGLGSGFNGDFEAGKIGLSVQATGEIAITSFSVDSIENTAFGTLAQYGDLSSAYGTTTATDTNFRFSGRLGATDFNPISGARLNVDNFSIPGNTTWSLFTTQTACNSLGCIDGQAVGYGPAGLGGGINGGTNYTAIFVSAGVLGNDWGSAAGTPYFEVWNSTSTITYVSALSSVPVPAAVWLFGSGLLGLIGIGKKRKKTNH
jgi:hypothetical protein